MMKKNQPKLLLLLLCCVTLLPSCSLFKSILTPATYGVGESLHVSSDTQNIKRVSADFDQGYYYLDAQGRAHIIMFDGSKEKINQAIMMEVLWHPVASKTPIDSQATNATLTYIVFAGDKNQHQGIYHGSGYIYTYDKVISKKLKASVWRSALTFDKGTKFFSDKLKTPQIKGLFNVARDKQAYQSLKNKLEQVISRIKP